MATNFFQRWSQRKLNGKDEEELQLEQEATMEAALLDNAEGIEVVQPQAEDTANIERATDATNETADTVLPELTLADAAKVTFDSGVSTFMKEGVEKSVKKAALRKLFHSDEFNYISDMDDHTEDFSNVPVLDTKVTSQLRQWVSKVTETAEEALNASPEKAITEPSADVHTLAATTEELDTAARPDVETGLALTIPTEIASAEPQVIEETKPPKESC